LRICSSGSGAYLLETTDKANRYKLNVGNLPPNKSAQVHFSYVAPLIESHEGLLFTIPETLFPKHKSYISSLVGRVDVGEPISAIEVLSDHPGIKTDPSGFLYNIDEPAFGISSEINFSIKIKSMEASGETTDASPQDLTKPTLVIENSLANSKEAAFFASVLDFRPIFASATPELASDYEFVVIADAGGAMYGPKMAQQITALKLLLHSLPSGCKFNLITTSSHFTSRFQTSVVLDEENMNRVLWTVEHLNANHGGETKLKSALASVFHRRDYLRNLCVFVLTSIDYESDSRAIFKLVGENASRNARVFAIGFGDEVDSEFLNGVAFAGRGKAHFVKEDDFVDGILFQQLVAAFQPRVRDIKVHWNLDEDAKARMIDQFPHRVPITASGASTLVYGLFEVPVPEGVVIPDQDEVKAKADDKKDDDKNKESSSNAPISAATASSSSSAAAAPSDAASPKKSAKREHSESATSPRKKKSKAHVEPLVAPLPTPTIPEDLRMPFKSVKITGIGPDESPLEWEIQASEAVFRPGRMIRAVAASKVCNAYNDDTRTATMSPEQVKQKVIDISTRFQVISKFTSFVAVEERRGEATNEAMKQVTVEANNVALPAPTGVPPIVPQDVPRPIHIPRPPICIHRPIRPIKHWMPPPRSSAVTHQPLIQNLTLSMRRDTFAPSFACEKSKKKSKGDSISGGSYHSASSASFNYDATSSLGFAVQSYEEDLSDDRFESILAQAPVQYKLAAPVAPSSSLQQSGLTTGGLLHKKMKENEKGESKELKRKVSHSEVVSRLEEHAPKSSDATASPPMPPASPAVPASGPPAPPPAPGQSRFMHLEARRLQANSELDDADHSSDAEDEEWEHSPRAHSSRGRGAREETDNLNEQLSRAKALPAKSANSRFSDSQMIPNKTSLSDKSFSAPAPKPVVKHVPLEAPPGWKPSLNLAAPMHTNAARLRAIVTAQHADGSWDINSVAQLLHMDATQIDTNNPLLQQDSNKDEAKTPKSARKGKKSKQKGEDKDSKNENDIAATSTAVEGEKSPEESLSTAPAVPSLSDIWATVILLSYLKHNYDIEKEFWTFVALKVAALLARAVPDESARNALIKKGHKYLSHLPASAAVASN
jgi:hypothetical protein